MLPQGVRGRQGMVYVSSYGIGGGATVAASSTSAKPISYLSRDTVLSIKAGKSSILQYPASSYFIQS
jgi:hypothetical protein